MPPICGKDVLDIVSLIYNTPNKRITQININTNINFIELWELINSQIKFPIEDNAKILFNLIAPGTLKKITKKVNKEKNNSSHIYIVMLTIIINGNNFCKVDNRNKTHKEHLFKIEINQP